MSRRPIRAQGVLTEREEAVDKVDRIAAEYADRYPWADHEALKLYFRLELVNDSLREMAAKVHDTVLPGVKGWLVAILRALYIAGGRRLSHAEISSVTRVPSANLTYQVGVLEQDGYVARSRHESDRRVILVELTPKGEALCEQMLPARTRFISELGKAFSEEEKRLFNELLERLEAATISYEPRT
jgi:DNA-binding MarR family transcriptional regulator